MRTTQTGITPCYFDETEFRVLLARAGHRTVSSLARQIGLSPAYLLSVVRGLCPPTSKRELIASALGVDVGALWRSLP